MTFSLFRTTGCNDVRQSPIAMSIKYIRRLVGDTNVTIATEQETPVSH
jgi:hypothetical protein